MKNILFHSGKHKPLPSLALLIQRLVFGAAMLTHGTPKIIHFSEWSKTFSDPFGIGGAWSFGLLVFAEFFCAILIILGLGTRPAAIVLVFAMGMAAFWAHSGEPFGKMELAVLFMAAFLVLLILGAGKYSLDKVISGK